ncbi:glypican-5b isoform X1 [Ictalurus furcatus]|uniref:glypican-5b isoform X1 n=2 Tax=Ictalurus furcatus TaxID=66913 RepID=UPI002350156E|nr:glypican-5b isoform X1 [Ictalurus furcatus]XP_053490495.1 glypican-5b isoform X1 [Ictalurus furcatus]
MLRETVWRVWICWILMSFGPQWGVQSTGAHSCHEVKTAFHLRQIGPLKWVPETAATDAELQICKHQGPTCCTRKMEESYHAAARRGTLQNILSYSLELKYLIIGHAAAVQDTFHSLLSFTLNHTLSLLDLAYEPIAAESHPLVSTLFSDLALYLRGNDDVSVVRSVRHFFDELFPLVYRHLVNPGLASSIWSAEGAECLRATRQDLNPFGPHPQALGHGLARVLGVGRSLMQALTVGVDVLNASESAGMAKDCGKAIVRMQFCSHCKGLTLIRPCQGLCLNVMRGCLAGLSELQGPWSRYIALLEGTSAALAGGHELELTLLGIRERINDAILSAQLNGPHLSAIVEKVCGPLTESASSTQEGPTHQSPAVLDQSSTVESVSSIPSLSPTVQNNSDDHRDSHVTLRKRSLPLKPSKHDKPRSLKKISKEFMSHIQRYKSFFSMLPEVLCDSEMVLDEYTCWNGEDVVESYTGSVVGNGLQAQKHNPEIKVRGVDPVLTEAKETLERFNQDMWAETGLDDDQHKRLNVDGGSGTETSGECDDEDGCEGSGEDEDEIGRVIPPFSTPSVQQGSGACSTDSSSLFSLSLFPLLLCLL